MPRPATVAKIARWALAATLATLPAQAQVRDRFGVRVELGAGSMASAFQRNADPAAYGGDVKGFGLALHGGLRLAFSLTDALALQASVSNWVFPVDGAEAGWVFAPMLGARFEPMVASVGRLFVDGNVGVGMTGDLRALQLDVGAGFEFQVAPGVSVGPMVRYGQLVQPDSLDDGQAEPFPDDARYVVGALSLSLHPTSGGGATASAAAGPRDRDGDGFVDRDDVCPDLVAGPRPDEARRGCPTLDSDGDGVGDAGDLCPTVAPGEHPDEYRRGCPARDRDDDGVPDDRDVCVDAAQGPHPDPMRPGCADADVDQDGVTNNEDACPDVAQGPQADPRRRGCPEGDTDGDGYVDSVDRCPERAETFNNITDEDGCPEEQAPTVEIRSGMIELQGNPVNFITGSDRIIGRRSFEILDALVAVLRAHAELARVDIQGHTDNVGDRAANLDLSARRALAVRRYVIDHGILPDRVESHGLGPDRPISDNGTPDGRAANRRVEVHIVRALPGAAARPQ
jgi:outer membrane protein OmpA-like peptidoglycan-associated protein